jgi:predicted P-loop ATPase
MTSQTKLPTDRDEYERGNIRDHLYKLTISKGGKYRCPVCGGNNLSISKEGATTCYDNGCEWKAIMDVVAPFHGDGSASNSRSSGKATKAAPRKKSKKEIRSEVLEIEIEIDAKTTELAYQAGHGTLTAATAGVELAAWCKAKGYDKFSASQQLKAKMAIDKKQRQSSGDFNDDDDAENQTRLQRDYWRLEKKIGKDITFDEATQNFYLYGKKFEVETAKIDLSIDLGIPIKSGKEDVMDICVKLANQNKFNSVVNYLEDCQKKDPIELDSIGPLILGTGTDKLAATMLRKWLISAVARAYEPGCKADAVVIFLGKQDQGKSFFFKELVPDPELFNEDAIKGGKLNDEVIRTAHRVWLAEVAEIDKLFKRSCASEIKTFMTLQREWIRPLYAKMPIQLPRHSIMAGTTNQQEFLTDETGNRRYWVIPVTVDTIDIEWLKKYRDNIWSAAVKAYKSGEIWYLNKEEKREHNDRNKQYQLEHPWQGLIEKYVDHLLEVSVGEILYEVLKMDYAKSTRSDQMQVAGILKTLGFSKTNKRKDFGNIRHIMWKKLPET